MIYCHVTDLISGYFYDQPIESCCEMHRFINSLGSDYLVEIMFI